MARIAINGFGRIGRLFFKQAFDNPNLEIVAINDLGNVENLAYLLKYDTAYGRFNRDIKFKADVSGVGGLLIIDDREIKFLQEKEVAKLPWRDLQIDIAVESTGLFESYEKAKFHLAQGAKRLVITAPAKDEDTKDAKTVLYGVNQDQLKNCTISSNGSCTTNSIAVVIDVINKTLGVKKAFLNTTHGYTATQNLVDGPVRGGRDFRRGRAAAQNISPSTTGAAIAVGRVIEGLEGKFDGVAMRVPIITGSMAHLSILTEKPTTVEEVNKILEDASKTDELRGVLETTHDQLVSSDIIGLNAAALVDLAFTKVIGDDFVQLFSWYDNEWGYVTTLIKHVVEVAKYVK